MFFEDLPRIHRRRENGQYFQVLSEETRGKRPSYFLQNFHFQSGGWMTHESAQRYDTQVEVLLNGTANAKAENRYSITSSAIASTPGPRHGRRSECSTAAP